jgi:hypothetical protein
MKIARLNFHDLTGLILEKDSLNIYLDVGVDCVWTLEYIVQVPSLFGWLVADDWCWFVLREEYCWLVAGGWFVVREKYCCLVADKPSEEGVRRSICRVNRVLSQCGTQWWVGRGLMGVGNFVPRVFVPTKGWPAFDDALTVGALHRASVVRVEDQARRRGVVAAPAVANLPPTATRQQPRPPTDYRRKACRRPAARDPFRPCATSRSPFHL